MSTPTLPQLQLERQQLRRELREMHSLISDLCQQNSHRKFSDVLILRTQSNTKQLQSLRVQYNDYCAILDGKYPNAINQQLNRIKQEKLALKKEISELQRGINVQVQEYSGEEKYLKEEFMVKAEMEGVRQKNNTKGEQLAKQVKQLAEIKQQMQGLNSRNLEVSASYAEEEPIDKEELMHKLSQLKDKKAKVLEDIQRKRNLRSSEYNRKIAKLDELDLITSDFEETLEYMEQRIIQTAQELERLQQQKEKKTKKRASSFALPTLQKLQTAAVPFSLKQQNTKLPAYGLAKVNKLKTSPLQQQYPEQYKDLFLDIPQRKPMRSAKSHQRSIGDRVRLGFE